MEITSPRATEMQFNGRRERTLQSRQSKVRRKIKKLERKRQLLSKSDRKASFTCSTLLIQGMRKMMMTMNNPMNKQTRRLNSQRDNTKWLKISFNSAFLTLFPSTQDWREWVIQDCSSQEKAMTMMMRRMNLQLLLLRRY